MAEPDTTLPRDTTAVPVQLELVVEGIDSAQAIAQIEQALAGIPDLVYARLNMTTRRLSTQWAHAGYNAAPLFAVLDRFGYRAVPFTTNQAEQEESARTKWLLRCLAVAGFATMNVMLLSVSVWSGNVTEISTETRDLFHWLSALIALPAAGFAGQPFFFNAIRAIRSGEMVMDVPISLGILLALGMSVYETAHHAEHAYFDSALMLLFFLLSGRVLDHVMRLKTRATAANLAALRAPLASRLGPDGSLSEVPADALATGDVIVVAAGQRIAADGLVVQGQSAVDESFLTGETDRRVVLIGDRVYAGMLNGDGQLQVQVDAVGRQTLLSEIETLIDNAVTSKSRYVQVADRVARVYAPVVHVTAALTAIGWLMAGASLHDAVIIAIAVLIITCPCALALAAPTVQVVVAGALFRKGVLMRSGDVIERMADVDVIVFDKTGTLTLPDTSQPDFARLSDGDLRLAGRLAQSSHHPLARALRDYARARCGPLAALDDVRELSGQGVCTTYQGMDLRLGSPAFCGLDTETPTGGQSLIAFARDGAVTLLPVGQVLRRDAVETIKALQTASYRVLILSGDRAEAVEPVARALGISEWQAGIKPADKLDALNRMKAEGLTVLMIGDGVNDAPALAGAAVSMSPTSGADVTQAAADALFMGEGLGVVAQTLALCHKGRAVMRENFLLALVYNLVAVPLAMAGMVTPLIAAAAMSGSSVLVAVNALRAKSGRLARSRTRRAE